MKAFAPPRTVSTSTRQTAPWPSIGRFTQQSRLISSTPTRTRVQSRDTPAAPASCRQSRRWFASDITASTPADIFAAVTQLSQKELSDFHARIEELAKHVLDHPAVPDEAIVLKALEEYLSMARKLVGAKDTAQKQTTTQTEKTATSALLSNLNTPSNSSITRSRIMDALTTRAFDMLIYRPVFITPDMLKTYVELQCLLQRPESFPAVFKLYREKPVPRPSKDGVVAYDETNPDKPNAAVAPAVADMAIDAAIDSRDLSLALGTIDATYCTKAYKRSKFLRSALFPLTGFLLTPPAAYTLATRFSDYQTTMDPAMATNIAMAGIMTYTMAVGTVGYVALTTANDQMVRVTWAPGVPLWERWVREEERSAFDKLSQAWGFASKDKWGEEEGEEWEYLKEFCGLRGMMLDRVELMDGME
ncbi:hypothetical protein E4T43_03816 [Aureobasidium subglaciale]|nr:hypothetical protein E4T43_03816 [Aureobasidium subglaciale]